MEAMELVEERPKHELYLVYVVVVVVFAAAVVVYWKGEVVEGEQLESMEDKQSSHFDNFSRLKSNLKFGC